MPFWYANVHESLTRGEAARCASGRAKLSDQEKRLGCEVSEASLCRNRDRLFRGFA